VALIDGELPFVQGVTGQWFQLFVFRFQGREPSPGAQFPSQLLPAMPSVSLDQRTLLNRAMPSTRTAMKRTASHPQTKSAARPVEDDEIIIIASSSEDELPAPKRSRPASKAKPPSHKTLEQDKCTHHITQDVLEVSSKDATAFAELSAAALKKENMKLKQVCIYLNLTPCICSDSTSVSKLSPRKEML
jgi:hypothetical protein